MEMRRIAHELGIYLAFVPDGMTEAYKHLDRCVFGAMTTACRRMDGQLLCDDIYAKMTKHLAVQFLIRARKTLSPHVLEHAWSAYTDKDEIQ
jgi:hypothetical protein